MHGTGLDNTKQVSLNIVLFWLCWQIIIMRYENGVQHPYGLVHVVTGREVYHFFWTEFTDGVIKRFDTDTNRTTIIRQESVPLFDMRLYKSDEQIGR